MHPISDVTYFRQSSDLFMFTDFTIQHNFGLFIYNEFPFHEFLQYLSPRKLDGVSVLDYGSLVWDPPGVVLQEELESVQKRAARFVTGNNSYETGSMIGILGQLKLESLKKL